MMGQEAKGHCLPDETLVPSHHTEAQTQLRLPGGHQGSWWQLLHRLPTTHCAKDTEIAFLV